MSRKPIARAALSLAFLVAALAAPARAGDAPAAPPAADGAKIVAHAITVRFEPKTHSLFATDTITVEAMAYGRLALAVGEGLTIAKASSTVGGPVTVEPLGGREVSVPVFKGRAEVTIEYAGKIFDAVEKKENVSWVVGDSTRGIVSEKGIYLHGGSGWYPQGGADSTARFDVTSYIPQPFLVVTQGRPPERSTLASGATGWDHDRAVVPGSVSNGLAGEKYNVSVAHAGIPTDACDLVAGPYEVKSRKVEGIEVSTYFQPGEAPDAGLWLDAADEVVRRYEPILGSYPHEKFDVVENFFSTGYGMPSFTLLGDDVIRYVTQGAKSTGKIPPGYLDHEYVHGWFGNGLFVDRRDGNWCEALTTYFSNYLAKELESKDAAVEHRRGTLEKYAIRVRGEKDYPVREFQTKTEDKDNDIGYGKGSMIFHILRKRLGDSEFFARVRRMASDRVGSFVSWTDWLHALDGEWAIPYLERKGLPAVRLASATSWPGAEKGTWVVRAEAVVDQPRGEAPWPAVTLDVDVDGVPAGRLRLAGKSGVWRQTITAAAAPKTIELDARYDAMRRIAEADLPMCLNTTLASRDGREGQVFYTEGVLDFEAFAKRISGEKHFTFRPVGPSSPPQPVPAIWLKILRVGSSFSMSGADGKPVVTATDAAFEIAGKRYTNPKSSVLVSGFEGGKPVTAYLALSDEAANRARMLGFYGWDQYVVFEAGQRKPVARGFLDRSPSGTRRPVATNDAAARVADDGERLASDELAGRRPGTPGHEKAERLLLARLSELTTCECGSLAEVRSVPFALGVADLTSSRDLILTTDAGIEVIHDAFRPLAGSPARAFGSPLPFAEGAGAVPLPGKWPDTTPDGLARLWRQLNESTTAPAVLLAPTAAARAGLAPFLDTPSSLTPESEAELAKPGHDGKPRARPSLPHWIAGRRMRAFPDAVPLRVPYLVLSDAAVERIDRGPAIRQIDFKIAWSPEAEAIAAGKGGVNLVAELLPEGAPKEKPPVVVLSAHYDSFGTVDGTLLRGADDNATGVAAVLEALRGLPESLASKKAKVGIVVALFDGEEWGLVGSRALAKQFAKDYDVRAVVNLDSIGRVRGDVVHVIGLSTHADLGKKAADVLTAAGLKAGPDIDKFAYTEGSDHWPFHALGVPAITLWASDYGVMNTATDEPDLVDPVGVARIAGAVRTLVETLVAEPVPPGK